MNSKIYKKQYQETNIPEYLSVCSTMLSFKERKLLYGIATEYFSNQGIIVDAGCFLGGSTISLGYGLRNMYDKKIIFSYDRFEVEQYMIQKYFSEETRVKSSFLDKFKENIKDIEHIVQVYNGNIIEQPIPEENIEILFLDVLKTPTVNDHVVEHFFSKLIVEKSLVIQQDYIWKASNGWIHCTMEILKEYFEKVEETPVGSIVFKYKKQIPAEKLKNIFLSLDKNTALQLQQNAISSYTGEKRKILDESANDLLNYFQKQLK